MTSKRYRNLSLPEEFVREIERFIESHPELGFTSFSEFAKYSIRAYLQFGNVLLKPSMKNEEPQ
jgi:Arc/MetJ-type ribon-helix-helix transcriptional regulator